MGKTKPGRVGRRPTGNGTSSTGPKCSGKVNESYHIIKNKKGTKTVKVEYFQRRPSKPSKKK
jgi:hypothetical protein